MIIIVSGVQIIVLDIDRCRCSLGDHSLSHVSGAAFFPQRIEREGLKVVHLIKEDSSVVFKNVFFEPTLENLSSSLSGADLVLTENFGADAPNKIEILRKYWSETPLSDEKDLIAVFADFPYHAETTLPVFDLNKPKNIVTFLREYLGRQ